MRLTLSLISSRFLGATVLALGMTQALAAGASGPDTAQAQAQYRQDMAVCNSGQSNQAPETCRHEARSALQEARRGGLTGDDSSYANNAQLRCAAHQGLDRSACEARMRGEGTTEGSVSGGGILRESVTVVPGS